jgi:hypothetical protein
VIVNERGVQLFSILIVLLSVLFFAKNSREMNADQIWFSNMDQDSVLLMETMRVNSGRTPDFIEHPGLGNYIAYGLGFKILKFFGMTEFDSYDELMAGEDPILRLPSLFHLGRDLSTAVCIFVAAFFALGIYLMFSNLVVATLAFVGVLLQAGILLQSALIRTELASMLFAAICFFFLAVYSRATSSLAAWFATLLSGVALGISALSKIVTIPLLIPMCIGFTLISWEKVIYPSKKRHWTATASVLISMFLVWYYKSYLGDFVLQDTKMGFLVPIAGVSSVVVALLWIRLPSVKAINCAFAVSTACIGYLAAIPVAYFLTNISEVYFQRYIVNIMFSTDMLTRSTSTGPIYAYNWGRIDNIVNNFWTFVNDGLTFSGVLVLAALSLLLAATKKARITIVLLSLAGLGLSLVCGIRYYAAHYLVYQESFLAVAAAIGFGQRILLIKGSVARALVVASVCGILVFGAVKAQDRGKNLYTGFNLGLRNAIEYVNVCLYTVVEFHRDMNVKYGNRKNVVERVFFDDRLNGSLRGIDISTLRNMDKKITQFKL